MVVVLLSCSIPFILNNIANVFAFPTPYLSLMYPFPVKQACCATFI